MVIANGRSPRRKRTTSPEERVEEIVGEMPEISQPLPGSPGRLTKSQQRKQQAAKINAMKQTRPEDDSCWKLQLVTTVS